MLSKVQLFDASRCNNNLCKNCSMKKDYPMDCIEILSEMAMELLKENEKMREQLD